MKWKEYARGCERRIAEMHMVIRELDQVHRELVLKIQQLEEEE